MSLIPSFFPTSISFSCCVLHSENKQKKILQFCLQAPYLEEQPVLLCTWFTYLPGTAWRQEAPFGFKCAVGSQLQADLEMPTMATDLPMEFLVPDLLAKVLSFRFGVLQSPTWALPGLPAPTESCETLPLPLVSELLHFSGRPETSVLSRSSGSCNSFI